MTKPSGQLSLLHEISHGLLGHQKFQTDIQLMRMEVSAWRKTRELAAKLSVHYDEDSVERCLETYRDWLHARSRCPNCQQTGLQQRSQSYRCAACGSSWRVPVSQACTVKRFKTT
jgi:hypothetical protein